MILHHTLLLNTWYLLQVNRHRDLHIHHIIRGVVVSQYITKCIFYVTNYHVELFFLYQIVTDDVCAPPTINRHKVTCMVPITRKERGRRVRDRMVVGFTTTYAISAYHR